MKITGLEGDPVGEPLYMSSIAEGLFETPDGQTPYYSAEINQEGLLIYGYNWDTRDMNAGEGWYRLTFWVGNVPYPENPLSGKTIDYSNDVIITSHDPGDLDDTGSPSVGFVHDDYEDQKFWIDIELVEKSGGRS